MSNAVDPVWRWHGKSHWAVPSQGLWPATLPPTPTSTSRTVWIGGSAQPQSVMAAPASDCTTHDSSTAPPSTRTHATAAIAETRAKRVTALDEAIAVRSWPDAPHPWRKEADVNPHAAGGRRGAPRHHLAHLERLTGGQGRARALDPDVGRFVVRDRLEGDLPVERGVALDQVPGQLLEERAAGRNLANERGGGAVAGRRGVSRGVHRAREAAEAASGKRRRRG